MLWLPVILILPYVILLVNNYLSLHRVKAFNNSGNPENFISVIVACRNEQKNLPSLLESLSVQNYPADLFEVIIVNDNSSDNTFEIAAGFTGIKNISVLNNSGTGKKKAIRTGVTTSSGKLIITTDADCNLGKNWIRGISSFYSANCPDMIICPVRLESFNGFFGRFQELEFIGLQGITAATALNGKPIMCNGASLAFSKEAYLNHSDHLHDEIKSGDDIFLLHSLKKDQSSQILWLESNDVIVTTKASPTLKSFLSQRSRWLSKSTAYTDRSTIIAGIITFLSISVLMCTLFCSLINPHLLQVFFLILVLKSIPDYLILLNTTKRYGRRKLMRWFLPAQLIYPFYVLLVVAYSVIKIKNPRPVKASIYPGGVA